MVATRKALYTIEVILQQGKQDKGKQTYHIGEGTSLLLDELRLQLRREHDLPLSKTSKSAIVQVAAELQAKNISQLVRPRSPYLELSFEGSRYDCAGYLSPA